MTYKQWKRKLAKAKRAVKRVEKIENRLQARLKSVSLKADRLQKKVDRLESQQP